MSLLRLLFGDYRPPYRTPSFTTDCREGRNNKTYILKSKEDEFNNYRFSDESEITNQLKQIVEKCENTIINFNETIPFIIFKTNSMQIKTATIFK